MVRSSADKRLNRLYSVMALVALAALFFSTAGLIWIKDAQALRVSMKRIIFEGPHRSDIITLMNNSADAKTYRLGWRRYRMDESRSLVNIEGDEAAAAEIKWAEDMIRYAPRRVTIPPGGSQQIRILLRRPRDLEAGEYRAHLWIITETEAEAFSPEDVQRPSGQSFRLTMQPALTMPIFVRHGQLEASARISDASLSRTENGAQMSFTLHRGGNRSLYGDLVLTCIGGGGDYIARQVRGIAVYPEVDKRFMTQAFTFPPEQASACSRVRVEYIADGNDSQYGGQLLASGEASL